MSAQTINNYVTLVKLIVASAIDEQGEPEFPRKWNSNYLDLPVISMQRRPAFSLEAMSVPLSKPQAVERRSYMLFLPGVDFASVRLSVWRPSTSLLMVGPLWWNNLFSLVRFKPLRPTLPIGRLT